MSIFSKIGDFLFGPSTPVTPKETKVEAVNTQPLPPGPPLTEEPKVAAGTPAKKPRAKKNDSWLEKDVAKPAGKKTQTTATGKTTRKAKAKTQ